MSNRFEILRPLEEDTASKLLLVRDNKRENELRLRRFKTQKPEEIEGLKELFRQLAGLENPHLDRLIDYGADKDGFYTIVAGSLPGESLPEVLERGPLTEKEFTALATQLLDVLSALHEGAIVHGSLRPEYVRISGKSAADWQVTLHGFGQGFAAKDDSPEEQIRAYRCAAPEQWQDGTTRRRTDVYALGCILYEALTARAPFDARVMKELRLKHLGHDMTPLTKLASHVPAWMTAWVMHLMAADPEQRPRKAAAAREQFEKQEAPQTVETAARPQPVQQAPVPAPAPTPPGVGMPPPQNLRSAPIMLPRPQPGAHNATSSTIPIAAGPHVAANRPKPGTTNPVMPAPRRAPSPAPAPRPAGGKAAPASAPSLVEKLKKQKPMVIAAAAVVLLLGLFVISRCGGQPEPVKKNAGQVKR
ncbi:serine/threonine protein kinase [Prosthecobacter vanneervenii]|uniref:non-specific serine/threonine protein kinase n=1 Tax=Prosthecobacter vanneervenii TaxID=48466 RepID=A0A7W8DKW2_9BACT|nr:protein kinase [Prosthecobacter vanneervenii]MBB5033633.1 serine/threonine protein kinase [Prosthecobacter vanneervenii]